MALNVVPRLLNVNYFIASFMTCANNTANTTDLTCKQTQNEEDSKTGKLIATSILLGLLILYSLGVLIIYHVKRFHCQLRGLLAMNWGTGLFGACLVLAPESKLLIFTSAVSIICHLLLLGSLAILQHDVLDTMFGPSLRSMLLFTIIRTKVIYSCPRKVYFPPLFLSA